MSPAIRARSMDLEFLPTLILALFMIITLIVVMLASPKMKQKVARITKSAKE